MTTPSALLKPRYFWRRVFAFVVDWTLVALLTTLLLFPFLRPDESGLRLGGGVFTTTTCHNVTSVTRELHDLVAPEVIAEARLCEVRPFGIYNGRTVNLVYARTQSTEGAVPTSTFRTLSVAIDVQDQVMKTYTPQSFLMPLLLLIASALFVARKGQTPGKRLAGLRVQGQGCAMCREARRLSFFVFLGVAAFALETVPADTVSSLAQAPVWILVAGSVAVLCVFFLMYVVPMVRWRGAMPYDRATGFEVVRTG